MAGVDLSGLTNIGGPSAMGAAGGAGLAAATGGLSLTPMLLSALLSFGPSAISGLLGKKADPQQELRKQLLTIIGQQPELARRFYQEVISSPGFSAAQGSVATGANEASNQVAGNLAARGIGTSGTGAILSGLTPSLVGSQLGKLHAAAQEQANQQAQNTIQQQIGAIGATSGPSQTRQLFGGGLEAFAPIFQNWLKSRYPGFAGATSG